ncbi:MAG: stage II sporulation protein M [Firmicutes bacterium]|nr:stage II sporulation protein M [Bacillota bacterium]
MQRLKELNRRMRPFLWIAGGLFFLGILLGAIAAPGIGHLLRPFVTGLRQEALDLRFDTKGQLEWALFDNNWMVSLYMVAGGLLLGLVPAVGVLINGALIGYVITTLSERDHMSPLWIVLAGVLPHGIFEIPAYLLAAGMGLRLGLLVARTGAGRAHRRDWTAILQDVAPIVGAFTVLLLIAAFMESHVTPWLLHKVI